MAGYTVTAPLVIARGDDEGHQVYLYAGARVPQLAAGELDRLRDGGFIAADEEPKDEPVRRRATKD